MKSFVYDCYSEQAIFSKEQCSLVVGRRVSGPGGAGQGRSGMQSDLAPRALGTPAITT